MTKATGYLSLAFLALVSVTIITVFIASNYPTDPKIIDIDLPLRIRQRDVPPDSFVTYETTYTQYQELQGTVIVYLVPVNANDTKTELSRTKATLPETHNLHVSRNVFIPPGTIPGEYRLIIDIVYQLNRVREVTKTLDSDTFFVLDPAGERVIRQTPPNIPEDGFTEPLEVQPAVIEVQGKAEVEVTGGSPSSTPQSDGTPEGENTPTPEPQREPSPTPTATPQPTPTPRPLFDPACDLLPILC